MTGLDVDLEERAFEKALGLEDGLIRFDLEEDLALLDGVTLLLVPGYDGRLFDGLSQLG